MLAKILANKIKTLIESLAALFSSPAPCAAESISGLFTQVPRRGVLRNSLLTRKQFRKKDAQPSKFIGDSSARVFMTARTCICALREGHSRLVAGTQGRAKGVQRWLGTAT